MEAKMNAKKLIIGFCIMLAVILMITSVITPILGLTASIGNARMVLRANVGDTIERSVLVRNVNNETIKISAFASGDLAKDIVLKNANFTLASGEEKNLDFQLKILKNGTTETKINIKFLSLDEASSGGVGLTSTIIVIAGGESEDNTGTQTNIFENFKNFQLNGVTIALITTGIILIVFIVLYFMYIKKGSNKRGKINKPSKENLKA